MIFRFPMGEPTSEKRCPQGTSSTQRTETSKWLQEKESNEILRVVASESGTGLSAQAIPFS